MGLKFVQDNDATALIELYKKRKIFTELGLSQPLNELYDDELAIYLSVNNAYAHALNKKAETDKRKMKHRGKK